MTRYLTTIAATLLIVISAAFPGQGLASEPEMIILRSAIKTQATIWVGQRVDLLLEVLARDGWAQIKMARGLEVSGAYIVRLETQGTRLSESISGYEYSGQQYELSLFPQRGGRFSVPPIPVDVEVRRWGAQAGTSSLRMKTPAVGFDVKAPPGAENLPGIISTTDLKARQEWDPKLQQFKVGNAIKRTIVMEAPDISGMAFAPLVYPAEDGLGVYPGESSVADSYSRGSLVGKRTEAVTYVFEKAGLYELPEIVIVWWDISHKKLIKIVLPAHSIKITAIPGAETAPATDAKTEAGRQRVPGGRQLLLILGVVIVLGIFWRSRRAIRLRWHAWQHVHNRSEKTFFRNLAEACRKNDAKDAYNRLLAWINHPESNFAAATIDQFIKEAGSEKLAKAVAALDRSLFKKNTEHETQPLWSGRELVLELSRCRRLQARRSQKKLSARTVLAPLNPH